jgi:hypothetical protein
MRAAANTKGVLTLLMVVIISFLSIILQSTPGEVTKQIASLVDSTKQFALVVDSSEPTRQRNVTDFEHQPGVVIAVKVHDSRYHMDDLRQSLCLLNVAYNRRVLYDILIFTTIPFNESLVEELQKIVAPASLSVQPDGKPLLEQLADLSPKQQETLINRCKNVSSISDFTWETVCKDMYTIPISYSWMSEFRSKQIWRHPALEKYNYMMWYDSDSFATQVWKQDPMAFMIRNDLVLLMAHHGRGRTPGKLGVQDRIEKVYNKTLCHVGLAEDGRLAPKYGTVAQPCRKADVYHVHGFFHLTNLDFYRSPQNLYWSEVLIGDGKFSRIWDDQLAVIVPPAMLAPDRAMDMASVNITPNVFHNGWIMMKTKSQGGGYKYFWRERGPTQFPEARLECGSYITVPIR